MKTTTCAAGATGPVRLHLDDGHGAARCGARLGLGDLIALDQPATCDACRAHGVRLVQTRRRDGELLVLRVDVEDVEAPKLTDIKLHAAGITVSGALKPTRRYAVHGQWFVLAIQQTDDGVRVELFVRADGARCGFLLSLAWAGLLEQEISVDVPWWPAVVACQWDGEGDVEEDAA